MIFKRFLNTKNGGVHRNKKSNDTTFDSITTSPLAYSWIINNKLAIGPMPKTLAHWHQLERDGFRSRFSCCYPQEHIYAPIPINWKSDELSLPDHRSQEILTTEKLISALERSLMMLRNSEGALYLHCFAGQERSVLVAVGIIAVVQRTNLFESLDFVRQCHKRARPMYSHLDILDQALKILKSS